MTEPSSLPAFPRGDPSDSDFVERVRAREESAFEALFHAHYNALCVFAERYVRSPYVAEELVEDVFCWIWEHRATRGLNMSGVKAYLYTSVRNRALRQLARESTLSRERGIAACGELALGMSAPPRGPDEQLEADEFARAVDRAVASLPPRCRQAFLLHRQHDLSCAEVAAVMRISSKTVENQLTRAVKALRESLGAWRPGRE